jgi:hypothetical protein
VAGGFELVERRVESAFFEVEDALGAGLYGLGDGVAVGWALGEGPLERDFMDWAMA